ncbi:hypothetical protein SteCoe_28608 [Stentor coeruleus]|uniref:Uncharacterized protein n=1 Tax=Stentor coeruleus TaxID=5963 RepID=A0A1R2B8C0_9CILI|nr:hypothetical protein SteCoe_28608 [Stentor coeruleus]
MDIDRLTIGKNNIGSAKYPKIIVSKPMNFLEYAKGKAQKKFVSTLARNINQYRLRTFLSFNLSTKITSLTKKLVSALQMHSHYTNFFQILKQLTNKNSKKPLDPLFTPRFSKTSSSFSLSKLLKRLYLKTISNTYFCLIYNNHKLISYIDSNIKRTAFSKTFYIKEMKKRLSKFERKMKRRQDITRCRAYLKVMAYSKALKFASPFRSRSNSPFLNMTDRLICYTPEVPRISDEVKMSANPLYLPLYKMVEFFDQHWFMISVVAYKRWKTQILLLKI